jgi:pimeloyl-ACP methyl ester carboxylesterase
MPLFAQGDVQIHYEERGSGFPILLLAPGGLRSSLELWDTAALDPRDQLATDYRVVAMSQRNAGKSTAPVSGDGGWDTYVNDQLDLMTHLGANRFHVAGMCIGVSYGLRMIELASQRVASLVAFQPIGLDPSNAASWRETFDDWRQSIETDHPEADDEAWESFFHSMFDSDFVFSVNRDFVKKCQTPILVLMGENPSHPEATSRELAALAPNSTLLERWKAPEFHDAARSTIADFLTQHTPGQT